ncbi:hypothetical protein QBC34DRAFT_418402, partial [Podospora aff. communis PSN243]
MKIRDFVELRQIPWPGRPMQEARKVPETTRWFDEAEVMAGGEDRPWFEKNKDETRMQYYRQLYRSFGWPGNFRGAECWKHLAEVVTEDPWIWRPEYEAQPYGLLRRYAKDGNKEVGAYEVMQILGIEEWDDVYW